MNTIVWRLHLRSSPEEVYRHLATATGRRRFWAEEAGEKDGEILFRFSNGASLRSRIVRADPPDEFALTYFDGSIARFRIENDGRGGSDLTLSEEGVSEENLMENRAGWVSVLLSLKAAVDHGVDLRNPDSGRTWEDGYVDV